MINYLIGLSGMWLLCDGLISIRLYPKQSWIHDHSIRLLRCFIGLFLIVVGGLNGT